MTLVDTSTSPQATLTSTQPKAAITTKSGVRWATFWNGQTSTVQAFEFWRSQDAGATWTEDTNARIGFVGISPANEQPDACLFLDVDDRLHFIWRERPAGQYYYTLGTPSDDRTGWTWGPKLQVGGSAFHRHATMVAHREGNGAVAHVFLSTPINVTTSLQYARIRIAADGTYSVEHTSGSVMHEGTSAYHQRIDVDFHHVGDGKTVKGGAPHIYIAWSNGQIGDGIWLRRATYAAGQWTWGTARHLDSGRYIPGDTERWLTCRFDGTRVIVAGLLNNNTSDDLVLYERDAADTATTIRVLAANVAAADKLAFGSASYDGDGNVYFVGQSVGQTPETLAYRRWVRATQTLGARTLIKTLGHADAQVDASLQRGFRGAVIGLVYTDYTGAVPYEIHAEAISANVAPTAPTWQTPDDDSAQDVTSTLDLTYLFNDDPGDSQTARAIKRVKNGGAAEYLNESTGVWGATEVKNTTGSTAISFPAGWAADGDTVVYYVKAWDSADAAGPYSAGRTIRGSTRVNPSITSPADAGTITQATVTTVWTVAEQTRYRAKLLSAAGEVLEDSGWVNATSLRQHTFARTVDNATTYKTSIQTANDDGLASLVDTHTFTTAFTPPPTPTLTATPDVPAGGVSVAITNPAPQGGEPALAVNHLWRREVGDPGDGIRIARDLAEDATHIDWTVESRTAYEWRVAAVGVNGAVAWSAWTA